ncbi:MAG TPA: methylmalonyl Co-A mutase-associated GTPase MeaB [Candidatus Coatesbacteria bacterium]|nr:methylmalonyl Co-A mutase-associated GTPase MeaB [Candidatus Coatesbacteria bacterium]
MDLQELLERFSAGQDAALARAISVIEDERDGYEGLLNKLYPLSRHRLRLGVTGPPGAGKSTLVGRLASRIVRSGETVGIIAVDPTSPFTGGALLGDRIRMDDAGGLPGVFIRSMGTRGSLGGLSRSTREVAMAMDAFGKERIIIETVGVGQSELDIAGAADTTVVVLVPESGDGVQAMKAGLLEIADVIVVNKADREGAGRIVREISAMLELKPDEGNGWRVPVLETVARDDIGTAGLLAAVEEHRRHLDRSGLAQERRRNRARGELREIVEREILGRVLGDDGFEKTLGDAVERILANRSTPYHEAGEILKDLNLFRPKRS